MTIKTTLKEVPGLFKIISLYPLRRTPGVSFDVLPGSAVGHVDAYDRVIHAHGAYSPGPVGNVKRPWYMHPHQEDHLLVLHGFREVDLFSKSHGKMESFVVTPEEIKLGDDLLYDGPAILAWPCNVFHRIHSSEATGSASVNLAVHHEGFDIRTNFNIYDLNIENGEYYVLREGHLDQPAAM